MSTTSAADNQLQSLSQPPPHHAHSAHQQQPASSSSRSSPSTAGCPDCSLFLSSTSLRRLILYRHAESLGNIGQQSAQELGDHNLSLSPLGFRQAEEAGRKLTRSFFLPDAPAPPPLIFLSPYTRTRQTLLHMLRGASVSIDDVRVTEDVRLREVEFGYELDDALDSNSQQQQSHSLPLSQQHALRERHGWLWYRFRGGESPADCYDRMSSFLSSLHRQLLRTPAASVLILSHGLTLRCLLMRFLHLSVDQFDALENPAHCERIDISREDEGDAVGRRLISERRGVGGGGGAWGGAEECGECEECGCGKAGTAREECGECEECQRLREAWEWKDWRRRGGAAGGGRDSEGGTTQMDDADRAVAVERRAQAEVTRTAHSR